MSVATADFRSVTHHHRLTKVSPKHYALSVECEFIERHVRDKLTTEHPLARAIKLAAPTHVEDGMPRIGILRNIRREWSNLGEAEQRRLLNGWGSYGDWHDAALARELIGDVYWPTLHLLLEDRVSGQLEFRPIESPNEVVQIFIQHGASKAEVLVRLDRCRAAVAADWENLIDCNSQGDFGNPGPGQIPGSSDDREHGKPGGIRQELIA